jgi:3-methyl-2-oxobutanoate hydroxymethyltransferase
MLTSYDYPTARVAERCGVDILLVGDSVGTNVLGYSDVSQVTMEDMVHHISAVARGTTRAFVLGDMPFGSFSEPSRAIANARRLIAAGADGVKMEGEGVSASIEGVVGAGIPVCAHIGYTPQTDGSRARVQGRDAARAIELIEIARRLQVTGVFMIVLELVPEEIARLISTSLTIPTVGIGAGRFCDGQVQVVHDILGITERSFRHTKAYATLADAQCAAIMSYAREVHEGIFPTDTNASHVEREVLEEVDAWLRSQGEGA